MQRVLVTTSWDDGDPADLKLAEMLAEAGVGGTFYICRDYDGRPRLSDAEIRSLEEFPGVEVGAHTLTHRDLRFLPQAELEGDVKGGRDWLQDLLGHPVAAFAYPRGLHNRRAVRAVRAAGFSLGRTVKGGSTGLPVDPFRLSTTMQVYPHQRHTQIRHAIKEGDIKGLRRIVALRPWSSVPAELAQSYLSTAGHEDPVVVHVWGHSWELNQCHLWKSLSELLILLTPQAHASLTNSMLVETHLTRDHGERP